MKAGKILAGVLVAIGIVAFLSIIIDKKATTPIATNTPAKIFPAFILICHFLF